MRVEARWCQEQELFRWLGGEEYEHKGSRVGQSEGKGLVIWTRCRPAGECLVVESKSRARFPVESTAQQLFFPPRLQRSVVEKKHIALWSTKLL